MLWALGDPLSFVLLLVAFVLAITARGVIQATTAARLGDRGPAREGLLTPDPRRHLDPFGAIAAAIAGVGWGRTLGQVDRRRRGALIAITVLPSAVLVLVGLALVAGFTARTGLALGTEPSALLRQGAAPLALDARALLLGGAMWLFVGLLTLVPLPPLDGGRLLFGLAPRTLGWQKAEHYLVERNYGIAALLILLVPFGGSRTLLLSVLDVVATPLIRLARLASGA